MPTDYDFCDYFTECFHCPMPFCPYSGWQDEDDDDVEEESEDEGW